MTMDPPTCCILRLTSWLSTLGMHLENSGDWEFHRQVWRTWKCFIHILGLFRTFSGHLSKHLWIAKHQGKPKKKHLNTTEVVHHWLSLATAKILQVVVSYNGRTLKIICFDGIFHYKPAILGYPHFRKSLSMKYSWDIHSTSHKYSIDIPFICHKYPIKISPIPILMSLTIIPLHFSAPPSVSRCQFGLSDPWFEG